jgi:hypothetical protein
MRLTCRDALFVKLAPDDGLPIGRNVVQATNTQCPILESFEPNSHVPVERDLPVKWRSRSAWTNDGMPLDRSEEQSANAESPIREAQKLKTRFKENALDERVFRLTHYTKLRGPDALIRSQDHSFLHCPAITRDPNMFKIQEKKIYRL